MVCSPARKMLKELSDTHLLCSPGCRARLWRSEVEAAVTEAGGKLGPLEERRRKRRTCRYPAILKERGVIPLMEKECC